MCATYIVYRKLNIYKDLLNAQILGDDNISLFKGRQPDNVEQFTK